MGGASRLIPGDIRTQLIPDTDLDLQGLSGEPYKLQRDIEPVLAVLMARGVEGVPHLIKCNDQGAILIQDYTLAGLARELVLAAHFASTVLTVPANKEWRIIPTSYTLTSTATVGNREVVMRVTMPSGVIAWEGHAPNGQGATLTVTHNYGEELTRFRSVNGSIITSDISVPYALYIPAGGTITVLDVAAIDTAGDTWTGAVRVNETSL